MTVQPDPRRGVTPAHEGRDVDTTSDCGGDRAARHDRRRKRSWVKLDRFAIFQVAREFRLTVHEQFVLQTVTMHADYRTAEWLGSATELAEYTRMSRSTATKAVARLITLGLIEEVEPFGPHHQGVLRVLCYDVLVTDALTPLREALVEARELATDSRRFA